MGSDLDGFDIDLLSELLEMSTLLVPSMTSIIAFVDMLCKQTRWGYNTLPGLWLSLLNETKIDRKVEFTYKHGLPNKETIIFLINSI